RNYGAAGALVQESAPSYDAFRLHVTQIDSGELLRQLDIQFAGRWNWMWDSPSQCRGCSDIHRHAAVSKEREHTPPRNHVSVFQRAYRRLTVGLLHLPAREQQP